MFLYFVLLEGQRQNKKETMNWVNYSCCSELKARDNVHKITLSNKGSGSISKLKEQNIEKGNEVEIQRDLDYPSDENIKCHTLLQLTLMGKAHPLPLETKSLLGTQLDRGLIITEC